MEKNRELLHKLHPFKKELYDCTSTTVQFLIGLLFASMKESALEHNVI